MWPAAIGVAAVAVLSGIYLASPQSMDPGRGSTSPQFQLTSANCSGLLSNATIATEVSNIYSGLANGTPAAAGPNSSATANLSAYPSLSAAKNDSVSGWLSICESGPYDAVYQHWGGSRNESYGYELNAAGHYQLNFGLQWIGPCAQPNGGIPCSNMDWWSYDLVTGQVAGPAMTSGGEQYG